MSKEVKHFSSLSFSCSLSYVFKHVYFMGYSIFSISLHILVCSLLSK